MMLDSPVKIDRLTQQFVAYLTEALSIRPHVKKWEGEKTLPLYLRELYGFYRTKLLKSETLLMVAKTGEEQTPATLAKQMQKVGEKWPRDLVYVNEAVSSLNRKRLITQKIPFVIPGNQMYLPMHGLDLREHFKKMHTARAAFSPSTQTLVLNAIYHPKAAVYTPTGSAKEFNYSTMTMTRAFNELEQAGLGEHTVEGKERCLRFQQNAKELWEAALPFMRSPVKKRALVATTRKTNTGIRAGLSVLAENSLLNEPGTPVLAVDQEEWPRIRKEKAPGDRHQAEPGETEIEIWAYSPARFAQKGIADPLSVYLSLKDSEDERVQLALEELLKAMPW